MSVPEAPDDEPELLDPELLDPELADELDDDDELPLEPQAATANEATAARAPIVMRRDLNFISLTWFWESLESRMGPGVNRA